MTLHHIPVFQLVLSVAMRHTSAALAVLCDIKLFFLFHSALF